MNNFDENIIEVETPFAKYEKLKEHLETLGVDDCEFFQNGKSAFITFTEPDSCFVHMWQL